MSMTPCNDWAVACWAAILASPNRHTLMVRFIRLSPLTDYTFPGVLVRFNHQHGKAGGLRSHPACFPTRRWLHLGRGQEEALGLRIESHGLGAWLSFDI